MKAFKTKPILATILAGLLSTAAIASDSVTAATSEDLSAFDANVAKARLKQAPVAGSSVGEAVSKQANELHGTPPAGYKSFGQKVSEQRRVQPAGTRPGSANSNANLKPESPGHGGNPNKRR